MKFEGWCVCRSNGYYRMFKRGKDGKMQSIYVGKEFSERKARQRIAEKKILKKITP